MKIHTTLALSLFLSASFAQAAPSTDIKNRPANAELSARAEGAPPSKFRLPGLAPRWARLASPRQFLSWYSGRGFVDKTTIFKPGDHPLGDRSIYNSALTYNRKGEMVALPRMEQNNPDGTWTSRVGMATSPDKGKTWKWEKDAVLAPSKHDPAHIQQMETAGIEDPRVTWLPETKEYMVAYSAVERLPGGGLMPRVAIARGKDLRALKKTGEAFKDGHLADLGIYFGGKESPNWSKAGSILSKRIVATDATFLSKFSKSDADKLRGKKIYGMYFGDKTVHFAASLDGINWMPTLAPVIEAVPGEKNGLMVEPGPPPLYDSQGNLHVFHNADGNKGPLYPGGYALFEAVFKANDPTTRVKADRKTPLLRVTRPEEAHGQVNAVVFTPGAAVDPKTGDLTFLSGMADSQTEMTVVKQSRDPRKRLSLPSPADK